MKHYDIDPEKLKLVFNNTTATYKFYWFYAILHSIDAGKSHYTLSFTEMVARMMSLAWKPLMRGDFSFGNCDALLPRIQILIFNSELNANDAEPRVFSYILNHAEEPVIKELVDRMTKYVPYRFLYPWLGADMTNSATAQASMNFAKYRCPYGIERKSVVLNPAWIDYFLDHCEILQDFTTLNLLLFLKKFNDKIVLPDVDEACMTADGASNVSYIHVNCPKACESNRADEITILKNQIRVQNQMLKSVQNMINILSSNNIGCTMTFNAPVGQAIARTDNVFNNDSNK